MTNKILIIEDDPDSRMVLAAQLSLLGYEIIEAANAAEGETTALTEIPDLIVMDLRLPGMDGIEATVRLKSNPKTTHIPVVAYTVWDKELYEHKAARAGIAAYLTKPTPPQSFKRVIDGLLKPTP